ncbi:MAG: hypothetical protein N2578_01010 [Bdellovibrionaceae bacterium]|nr:hypothetical protein [Pseudobdellovibrionaceae bacterium]
MIFAFLMSTFGYLFAARTLNSGLVQRGENIRSRTLAVLIPPILFCFNLSLISIWTVQGLLILWMGFAEKLSLWLWWKKRDDELIMLLEESAMGLLTGAAWNSALSEAIATRETQSRIVFSRAQEMAISGSWKQAPASGIRDIAILFVQIATFKGKAFELLRNKVALLKTRRLLRQKSGRASAQVRAQAAIVSIMYFLLFFFSVHFHGWDNVRIWFGVSLVFFLAGLTMMVLIFRSFRWKA